jgi:HTH-type transcriptional regulator / antitoxin HigA
MTAGYTNECCRRLRERLLEQIVALEDPSPEVNEIADLLVMLIEKFEERYTLPQGTPLETLRELMAANDLKQKDLVALGNSKGMLSNVLNGTRPISRRLAQVLAERFNVPHTLFL